MKSKSISENKQQLILAFINNNNINNNFILEIQKIYYIYIINLI